MSTCPYHVTLMIVIIKGFALKFRPSEDTNLCIVLKAWLIKQFEFLLVVLSNYGFVIYGLGP